MGLDFLACGSVYGWEAPEMDIKMVAEPQVFFPFGFWDHLPSLSHRFVL